MIRRHPGSIVRDQKARPPVLGREPHSNGRRRVSERVVEENPQQLPERVIVPVDRSRRGLDHQFLLRVLRRRLAADLLDERRQVERRANEPQPGVGAGERQQPVDEPRHPAALLDDVGGGGPADILRDRA